MGTEEVLSHSTAFICSEDEREKKVSAMKLNILFCNRSNDSKNDCGTHLVTK